MKKKWAYFCISVSFFIATHFFLIHFLPIFFAINILLSNSILSLSSVFCYSFLHISPIFLKFCLHPLFVSRFTDPLFRLPPNLYHFAPLHLKHFFPHYQLSLPLSLPIFTQMCFFVPHFPTLSIHHPPLLPSFITLFAYYLLYLSLAIAKLKWVFANQISS